MKRSIQQSHTQCTFDFDALSLQPVPEVVLRVIDEISQDQKYWWSDLEHRTIPRTPGIYCIVNLKDQSFYVGSATSLQNRKHHHFRDLKAGNHKNAHLQRAYHRDGVDAFRFCILEHVKHASDLLEREQHFIDTLNPHYNIARTAGSNLGMQFTDEHKGKISAARRANPGMPAQMEKLNADRTGKPLSPEHRATISKNQTGRKHSDASKEKMSAVKKGKKKTPEHAANISAGKKGKPRDPKTAEMLRTSRIGTKASPETKAKQRDAKLGKKRPPSVGAKISATKQAKRLAQQHPGQPSLF